MQINTNVMVRIDKVETVCALAFLIVVIVVLYLALADVSPQTNTNMKVKKETAVQVVKETIETNAELLNLYKIRSKCKKNLKYYMENCIHMHGVKMPKG